MTQHDMSDSVVETGFPDNWREEFKEWYQSV